MKKLLIIFLFISCCMSGYSQTDFAKWRINLSGGIGYDVENTSDDEKQMLDLGFSRNKVNSLVDDLKLGGQGNADIHYLVNKNVGIGLKYVFFKNDGKITETFVLEPATGYDIMRIGAKQKDIIHYIAPSFHIRHDLGNSRFAVSATLSGGYTHYKSEVETYLTIQYSFNWINLGDLSESAPPIVEESKLSPSGGTFGLSAGIGLEYFITKQIAAGIDAGYFYSSLNNIKIEDNLGQKISLKELNNGKDAIISR